MRVAASCGPPVVLTYTRSVKTGPFFSREFSKDHSRNLSAR
jgi:hypothetical protein